MRIYKIIKQTSINDRTGERKERFVLIQTYTTFIERIVTTLLMESQNPFHSVYYFTRTNTFDTIEKAREEKERLEITYTHKNEVVE